MDAEVGDPPLMGAEERVVSLGTGVTLLAYGGRSGLLNLHFHTVRSLDFPSIRRVRVGVVCVSQVEQRFDVRRSSIGLIP